ncbi:MAG: hypothetical protein IJZ08_05280 [Clostridia bacterium]|nr:hypothetical protein [Clostridia bacterium]
MKCMKLLEAFGLIHESYVTEASPENEKKISRGNASRLALRYGALAAALALVILGGMQLYRQSLPQYATEMLSVSETDIGMGFEGYQVYEISELRTDNPTDGKAITSLNAYRNTISYDERLYPYGQDLDAMKAYLLSLADKLGLDTDTLEILDNAPGEGQMQGLIMEFASRGLEVPEYYKLPYIVYVQTENYRIEVNADMTATIFFTERPTLPAEYHFTHTSTPEELAAAGEYLWSQYGDLVGYENPQMRIKGGNYSIEGTQSYSLAFYEGERDKTENFENYSFNRAEFAPDSDGKLYLIHIYSDAALEKIGLYPLISEEAAKALLLDGQYYTSVTEEFPGEDAVVRCELMYRAGSKDKILLPFYRFYVLLENAPGMHLYPDGMQTYGAYYVPAVDPAYLQ